MKTFAIIPNEQKDPKLAAANRISSDLALLGASVIMEKSFAGRVENVQFRERSEMFDEADFAVVIGGDGTMLDAASGVMGKDIHLVGINYGKLGFLSQAEKEDKDIFKNILDGKYETDSRMAIEAKVIKNGSVVKRFIALNDVVIFRGEYSRMIKLELYIDNVHAQSYAADGLIVATPTGSTAYSLSAGGPIVDPDMDCITITPICPHTIGARSIIIPAGKTVRVQLVPPYKTEGVVAVDGKEAYVLAENEFVELSNAPCRVNLVRTPGSNFFDILRKKLY